MSATKKTETQGPIAAIECEREYASLRLHETSHKLRFGHGAKLVEAGGDQKIILREKPYPHFVVLPSGIEIPVANVASAIPKGAALADRVKRTTTGKAGIQRAAKWDSAKAASKATPEVSDDA